MESASGSLSVGAAVFVFLAAAVLTVPVSLALLWLYRRAVRDAMRRPAGVPSPPAPPPPAVALVSPPAAPLVIETIEQRAPSVGPGLVESAGPALRPAQRGPWVTALVYGVAGIGHAAVTTFLYLVAAGMEFFPLRTLVVTWVLAWPVVLTLSLAAAGRRLVTAGIYFGGLLGLFALARGLGRADGTWRDAPLLWATLVGVPTVFLLAFLHRRLRAVGPLVLVFMVAGVGGAHLATSLVATDAGLRAAAQFAVAAEVDAAVVLLGLALAGFALFGVLGWLSLGWIGRRYASKRISDQSLAVDTIWLLFTLNASLNLVFEGSLWPVAALSSFVVYKALAGAGFALARRGATLAPARPNYRLLLLRVFSSPGRSERLMARAGARWRYAGSIQLIAGTDLATTTLEPHEFLDFVRGKLAGRFVQDRAGLERQLRELDLRPDADGRFRVNEFFCHDDTWRMTLSRLVAINDAVLMDLRGFTPANQGCIYELRELVSVVALGKIVLVVDGSTDIPFLRRVLDDAWAALPAASPNRRYATRLAVCHLTRDDDAAAGLVLGAVARAAAADAAAAAPLTSRADQAPAPT
jgi:hypothetical protein